MGLLRAAEPLSIPRLSSFLRTGKTVQGIAEQLPFKIYPGVFSRSISWYPDDVRITLMKR
jgi:hypothetical protein